MKRPFAVAIVGMGPTGACVLYGLLARLHERPPEQVVEITLIDPADQFGYGYAFQSDRRLNMRAASMSITPASSADFSQWIKAANSAIEQDQAEFPPRRVFGDYLADSVSRAVGDADGRIHIQHWRSRAVDILKTGDRYSVTGDDGQEKHFSALVLALGESRYNAFFKYSGLRTFVASPWEADGISALPEHADVGILGSSLSAVDACIQLLLQNHAGTITCLSRARGFPKVQGHLTEYNPAVMDDEWLAKVTCGGKKHLTLGNAALALKMELDGCMGMPYEPGTPDPREWFSAAGHTQRSHRSEAAIFTDSLHAARQDCTRWYYALDSISRLTPSIWHGLSVPDQLRFLDRFYSLWCEYRHSMPLINAESLAPAVEAGQLVIKRGLKLVAPVSHSSSPRWQAVCAAPGRTVQDTQRFDFIIDATGGQVKLACERETLLINALRRGILRRDACGGVEVDFGTCRAVSKFAVTWRGLFVVGPMTFGTHFYTNSFETNRDLAFRVARQIEELLRQWPGRPDAQPALRAGEREEIIWQN